MKNFCILDGELENQEKLLTHPTFTKNDFLSEKIRLYDTKALHLQEHIQRLQTSAEHIGIQLPDDFETERLRNYIYRLLNVNKVYLGGCCEIMIFWKTDMPHDVHYVIFITALDERYYSFNAFNGHKLWYDANIVVQKPFLPSVFSRNSYHLFQAKQFNNPTYNVLCFCDESGRILSSSKGNLAYVKDNNIHWCENTFTEPFTSNFFNSLDKTKWNIVRHETFTKEELQQAKEMFIVEQFFGIQWICWFADKDYVQSFSYDFSKKLNEEIKI